MAGGGGGAALLNQEDMLPAGAACAGCLVWRRR
jgi:hypothetical protein